MTFFNKFVILVTFCKIRTSVISLFWFVLGCILSIIKVGILSVSNYFYETCIRDLNLHFNGIGSEWNVSGFYLKLKSDDHEVLNVQKALVSLFVCQSKPINTNSILELIYSNDVVLFYTVSWIYIVSLIYSRSIGLACKPKLLITTERCYLEVL